MKIVFVNPPARKREYHSIIVPPLGLLYVATHLRHAGYDVRIKDAFAEGMDWYDYERYIEAEKPDIMGIGGMTPVIDTSFRAMKIARPHVRYIIMGGPHLSLYRKQVFDQCPEVDIGVVGEGEETTLTLMNKLAKGSEPDGMEGIITRNGNYLEKNTRSDVDGLPIPDRSMIPNRRYHYPMAVHSPVTTLFSSRGCPYGCTFCDKSTFGSVWRGRSADSVMAEIDDIVLRFGIKSLIFYDDLFTFNRDRVVRICEEIIRKKYRIDWKCEGRVNLVDPEVLRLMRRAGCSMIAYGAESANPKGLDYLNKKMSVDQIEKAFELTARAGIRTMAYFILGIPVETYEQELETITLAKRIHATYAQFSLLSPYYGTKVYDDAIQKGWYREVDAKNPLDSDLKRPVMISENWSEEKLRAILKTAHRQFYLRPGYPLRLALSIRSLNQAVSHLRELFHIISWLQN